MAITVTLPVAAPTGLSATLQAGGSLEANTTYYFIVIAYATNYYSPITLPLNYHSPISVEQSFTTDSVNRSVLINWTNVAGAERYQILLTKISGDYTQSGGYTTIDIDIIGSISSGVTGYTITALSTSPYAIHSVQRKNVIPFGLTKTGGMIQVQLSGGTSYGSLGALYDAIVAAGFSDYAYWDGYQFALKGYIYVHYGTDSGSLLITRKRLAFYRGGVVNLSSNYLIRFGTWISNGYGAGYSDGCDIDIAHTRYPFYSTVVTPGSPGRLQVYGSKISQYNMLSFPNSVPEVMNFSGYDQNTNLNIGYDLSGFRDLISGLYTRNITSDIYDAKFIFNNNFSNYKHVRIKVLNTVNNPYSATPAGFYQCDFAGNNYLQFYSGSVTYLNHKCRFRDCLFSMIPSGVIEVGNLIYSGMTSGFHNTNQYVEILYSIKFIISDVLGNTIEDVIISGVDKLANPVRWIGHDKSIDRIETGIEFSTNRLTDVNGEIDYYLLQQKAYLDPANVTYPNSTQTIHEMYHPYTFTISKEGYETAQVIIPVLKERTIIPVVLKPSIDIRPTLSGRAVLALNPEQGSSSDLEEV